MQPEFRHIWYASYGSNLSADRFLCYIQGGQPKGSSTKHRGCRDKTLPIDNRAITINRELYFARLSTSWGNGGAAFIRSQFHQTACTLGRMYRITVEQFIDVVKQEIDHEGDLELNFEKALEAGSYVFQKTEWYGNLIYLGMEHDNPIFTFTSEHDIQPFNKPSQSYLKTIIVGLREMHNHLSIDEIVEYLVTKGGIHGNYTKEELKSLIENVTD